MTCTIRCLIMTHKVKLKILHVIGNLSMGGAEFQCAQLANNCNQNQYNIGVVYLHSGPNHSFDDHVALYKIRRGRYFDVWNIWKQMDRIIEEFKPDIIQAWLPEIVTVPAVMSAFRRRIPVISGHRNTLSYEGDFIKIVRDFLRSPQYLLAQQIVSNFSISEEPFLFRLLYKAKKGCCIFNGIDVEKLSALKYQKLPDRAKHQLIYAGRLAPQKGLPLVFRAIKELVDSGEDVHLTLFGEGGDLYESKLRTLVNKLGITSRVTFFGQCSGWQAYAEDACAMVFPSRAEGTSNSVMEALAVGLPVVISDIAMSRQLLRDNENALIVKKKTPEDWAEKIHTLLSSDKLKSKLKNQGKALSEEFSVSSMVSKYTHIYDQIAMD